MPYIGMMACSEDDKVQPTEISIEALPVPTRYEMGVPPVAADYLQYFPPGIDTLSSIKLVSEDGSEIQLMRLEEVRVPTEGLACDETIHQGETAGWAFYSDRHQLEIVYYGWHILNAGCYHLPNLTVSVIVQNDVNVSVAYDPHTLDPSCIADRGPGKPNDDGMPVIALIDTSAFDQTYLRDYEFNGKQYETLIRAKNESALTFESMYFDPSSGLVMLIDTYGVRWSATQ